MDILIIVIKISAIALGAIFIYCGLFLYEKEEKNLQNRIESFWIKLSYMEDSFINPHLRVLQISADTIVAFMILIFGEKRISYRLISNSILLSLISFYLFNFNLQLYKLYRYNYNVNISGFFAYSFILTILYFLFFLSFKYRSSKLMTTIIFYFIVLMLFFWIMTEFYSSENLNIGASFFIVQLVITSILSDIILLIISITIISKLANSKSNLEIIRLFFKILLTSFFIVILPIICNPLLDIMIIKPIITPPYLSIVESVSFLFKESFVNIFLEVEATNVFTLLPIFFLIVLTISYEIHKICWPLLLRPAYFIQRIGFLNYKKTLVSVGVAIMFFAFTAHTPSFKEIIELLGFKLPK